MTSNPSSTHNSRDDESDPVVNLKAALRVYRERGYCRERTTPVPTEETKHLSSLASLAPLMGGVAVEAMRLANIARHDQTTTHGWSSDFVDRVEGIHAAMHNPQVTAAQVNQQVADLAANLVAYIINNGGTIQ